MREDGNLRVVSLLPSATEMVHFAGAAESLVGVTHECDYPAGVEGLPKLTNSRIDPALSGAEIDAAVNRLVTDDESLYALDADLLESLAPDLIITQGLCEVCAVSTGLVEEAVSGLRNRPELLVLNPASLEDVLEDSVRIGDALGCGERARENVALLRNRLDAIESAVDGLARPRVGCIEWLDPPFSAGHWVPEMVRLAGGRELFAGPGERSVRLDWETVFEAAPEVLVLMPCGFDAARAAEEAKELPNLPGWRDLPAVKNGRVWVVDANSYFSRPAPRLVDGVEILSRILHPGVFPGGPERNAASPLSPSFA
ncbi:MAG TPA: cobalamin-binding protein [Rubrobacter sp.]|nr:cobalamin-binding protein [Rubrobacter sp.]